MALLSLNPERTTREARQAVDRSSADRSYRRRRWWIGFVCAALWAAGTTLAWSSFATVGEDLPGILLSLGLVVGNVGPFIVLVVWMVEVDRRGE